VDLLANSCRVGTALLALAAATGTIDPISAADYMVRENLKNTIQLYLCVCRSIQLFYLLFSSFSFASFPVTRFLNTHLFLFLSLSPYVCASFAGESATRWHGTGHPHPTLAHSCSSFRGSPCSCLCLREPPSALPLLPITSKERRERWDRGGQQRHQPREVHHF